MTRITATPEVAAWLNELEGFYIPNLAPTADGSCAGDLAAAADAANRGWWTCGGYTRDTGTLFILQTTKSHLPLILQISRLAQTSIHGVLGMLRLDYN